MILNFGIATMDEKEKDEGKRKIEEDAACEDQDEEDEVAPLGLGARQTPGYAEKIREMAPKRSGL